jgi:hypothetical protein
MGKLLYNCAVSPREERYRRIKLTNKRLAETLGANPAALEALTALGWVADIANSHELVVPEGVYFTMKEVSMCIGSASGVRSRGGAGREPAAREGGGWAKPAARGGTDMSWWCLGACTSQSKVPVLAPNT